MLLIYVFLLCMMHCSNSEAQWIVPSDFTNIPSEDLEKCEVTDVVFLIDKACHIGRSVLQKEKQLVMNLLGELPIAQDQTRVSVISFSKGLKVEFKLDQKQSKEAALRAVEKTGFGRGCVRWTHRAINKARTILRQKARDGAHRAIVYITAGPATKQKHAYRSARQARKEGIRLFAVGMGSSTKSTELGQLAFKNEQPYVVNNFPVADDFM